MTILFNFSASSIVVKENGVTKDTRNISENVPEIDLISPFGGQIYSNQEIVINWTASDPDNETLAYAVLFSPDNGTTYNTIIFDHNETLFNLSSNDLEDSNSYLIKVLATDGVNTNESVMNSTFEIDNDLQIKNFSIVYQNNTERVFKINLNNTLSSTISNITWEFNSGEDVKNSVYNATLQPHEEALFFIYHNYSIGGNYNVSFRAERGIYIESDLIEVVI